MKLTSKWKTVLTDGFTAQIGSDSTASGGVCFTQLRIIKGGHQKRKVNSNCGYTAASEPEEIAGIHAMDLIRKSEERAANDRKNGR